MCQPGLPVQGRTHPAPGMAATRQEKVIPHAVAGSGDPATAREAIPSKRYGDFPMRLLVCLGLLVFLAAPLLHADQPRPRLAEVLTNIRLNTGYQRFKSLPTG